MSLQVLWSTYDIIIRGFLPEGKGERSINLHAKNQSFTFAPDSRAMKLEGSYFNACKALCKVNNLHPLINYTP